MNTAGPNPTPSVLDRAKFAGRFVAFPVFAIVGYIPLVTGWPNDHWGTQAFLIGLLAYSWFCIGGLSHELIHGNLHVPKWLERSIAHVIGTFLGIPQTAYRETHLRHHAYLNTPLDLEMWPYSDPRASLRFRRFFVWFELLLGVVSAPIIYGRVYFSGEVTLRPQIRRQLFREYVAVGVFLASMAGLIVWAGVTGRVAWTGRHLLLLLPLSLAASMNSVRKMIEHLGLASYEPLHGTRTVIGDNVLTRTFSYFDFDLATHGPHHRHPKLTHDRLAESMRSHEAENPDESFPVFPSFRAALAHTLRSMFLTPACGVNAGGHTNLGHLPGLKPDSVGECLVDPARAPGVTSPAPQAPSAAPPQVPSPPAGGKG